MVSFCCPVLELCLLLFNTHNILIVFYSQAFYYTMIKKIKIPENMKMIGQSAFEPSTLKEILFKDGSKLQTILDHIRDFILHSLIFLYENIYLFYFLFLGFQRHPINNHQYTGRRCSID